MASYKTIEGVAKAEIVEKKSRFIAHLSHVGSEEEALEFLGEIRSEHAQARHNVYAYMLRGGRVRYSDDGEPAQTSGMPTYETLSHAGLTDVICVTTRYFGGTLLGTGGLVRAYTLACQEAIKAAHVVMISECVDVEITVPYDMLQQTTRIAENDGIAIVSTEYTESVKVRFRTLAENADVLCGQLTEATRGKCAMEVGDVHEAAL